MSQMQNYFCGSFVDGRNPARINFLIAAFKIAAGRGLIEAVHQFPIVFCVRPKKVLGSFSIV